MKQEIFKNVFAVAEKTPVEKVLQDIRETENPENAFFAVNLDNIIYKYNEWKAQLPRVKPFYAVKCNDSEGFLKILVDLGFGFDCASKVEIQTILSLNVDKSRILFGNPCKVSSHIRYAAKVGVDLMTFDNELELHKIHNIYPQARLILRIKADSDKIWDPSFEAKYGADPSDAHHLLQTAQVLGLSIVGVSFHVGTGCEDPTAFSKSIHASKVVFDLGLAMGFPMEIMDIGGGFPGIDDAVITFPQLAEDAREALNECFPEGVQLIGEPGRYFAASAFTLSTSVIGKRSVNKDDWKSFMYYLNDGLYGSFNCLLHDDNTTITASALKNGVEQYRSSLWGPTCDSLDQILEECDLPELDVGDVIYFKNMGAYTISSSTTFNGFPKPKLFYYASLPIWSSLTRLGMSLNQLGEERRNCSDALSPSTEQLEQWRNETVEFEQLQEEKSLLVVQEQVDDTYALVAALM